MKGKIIAISIGHSPRHMTPEAVDAIKQADVIAGHRGFIEMASSYISSNAEIIDDSQLMSESKSFVEHQQRRVASIVSQAILGKTVAVLSGGDTGIWGQAGFLIETLEEYSDKYTVEVIPGVCGAVAGAASIGAPLMNGFVLISIGDEDTPFKVVQQRIRAACLADISIVLYKVVLESIVDPQMYPIEDYPELYPPVERTEERLNFLHEELLKHRSKDTPVAIISNISNQTSSYSREQNKLTTDDHCEMVINTTLEHLLKYKDKFNFFTTVYIGDSTSKMVEGKLVTPQWSYNWQFDKTMMHQLDGIEFMTNKEEFVAC